MIRMNNGFVVLLIAASSAIAVAQTTVRRVVVGAGGGPVSTGATQLTATIGQSIVGSYTADATSINAGFWASGATPCPIDFNGDGFITFEDFDAFVAVFTAGDAIADFNRDGFITFEDFDAFVTAFEAGC